jgi:hypothetical protein
MSRALHCCRLAETSRPTASAIATLSLFDVSGRTSRRAFRPVALLDLNAPADGATRGRLGVEMSLSLQTDRVKRLVLTLDGVHNNRV